MRCVIDTSAISAFSPGNPVVPQSVRDWFIENQDFCYLTVITVIELERGVARLFRLGHTAKAKGLEDWLHSILENYSSRLLELDLASATIAGKLMEEVAGKGFSPGLPDTLIAAMAKRHDMAIVTRNGKDFNALGSVYIDPFAERLSE